MKRQTFRVLYVAIKVATIAFVVTMLLWLKFTSSKERTKFEEQERHNKEMQLVDTLVKYDVVKKVSE